ncbi:P4 alpha zinc-binding domain protein [Solidesulfovibrio fructosivorans JJ]]|uniref:p4 alpha zinc-binding domain protein n=1 Tax=Solidesulfovibrio fructosivorans JJ] TaxID=596151 RepID=E1JUS1_SOLFR|nr:primase-helicase zinc-binding domain-containing protein [Solidesulfovibrio fructosivorans]EFL51835.1 P4 alpha zinc-binding domain protein [Solidesulfovibrio fructosivorans JJ]]
MTILEHPVLAGAMKYVSATSGGEYAGPCPWCSGTDRFRLWPAEGATGRWMCRGCGRQGDGIQFLRDMEGLSYPDACKRLGTTPKAAGTTHTLKPAPWEPKPAVLPGEAWIARAGQFIDRCAAALAAGGPGMEYARGRGLTARTCAALRIGWNPSDLYEDRAAWGLPEEINPRTGKPRRVWLPSGLVIPTLREGQVVAIKIRRSKWTPEDQLPKYAAASGGGKLPMVLAPGEGKPCVVVESELDAILAAQEARDAVSCVALGTAKGKPDAAANALFMAAPVVLVALDFDEAGATAWPWWRSTYPKAKRWPVPAGKDVGDLAAQPGMIRAWIEAGLPDPERNVEPEPVPESSHVVGPILRRAADLAHGAPCTTSEAELAKLRETFPHLYVCPATTPPWNFRYVSDCATRCATPCELQATN